MSSTAAGAAWLKTARQTGPRLGKVRPVGKKPSRRARKEARLKVARATDRGLPPPSTQPEALFQEEEASDVEAEAAAPPSESSRRAEAAPTTAAASRSRHDEPARAATRPTASRSKRSNRTWVLLLGLVAIASIFAYYSFDRSGKSRDAMVPVDVPKGPPTGALNVVEGPKPATKTQTASVTAAAPTTAAPGVVSTPPIDSSPPTVVPADAPKATARADASSAPPPKAAAPKAKPKPASDPY